jgi:CheY-like chemotaxis protein
MDEDVKRRCLEPFFTTKGERGTGLGLAMVYGMVKRHGADIGIESAPGRGTVFRLSFPLAPVAKVPEPPAATPPGSKLRLLVVDDDALVLGALSTILRRDGHVVTTACGGDDGIAAFRKAHDEGGSFDVVITDLGMPRTDGRKVASAIKATSPTTPVLLLTGWGQGLTTDEGLARDVDFVLGKPPSLRDLREALARLVPASPASPGAAPRASGG